MLFNPLDHPIVFSSPRRLTPLSAWHEHIPFAMCFTDLLKPSMLVELGTHYGDSYCAFCQAVQELNLSTRCYAIDTWEGDPQTGFYGPEVLASLREHHDPLYSGFSTLIKSTFDAALSHFSDGTIDLLHIDGYPTYDVVHHDFDSWFPKMSVRGVVLFHDTNVRERDSGVWKFWEEIKAQYLHFEFVHGHGLGVLAVGQKQSEDLRVFFGAQSAELQKIRNFFFQIGLHLTVKTEHHVQLEAERAHFLTESARLNESLRVQEQALAKKAQQQRQLQVEREQLIQRAGQLGAAIQAQQQTLAERDQLIVELQETIRVQQLALGNKDRQTARLMARLESEQRTLANKGQQIRHHLAEHERFVQELGQLTEENKRLLAAKDEEIRRLDEAAEQKKDQILRLEELIREREAVLNRIYDSHGWKALSVYYRFRNKLLPEGSRRRSAAKSVRAFVWNGFSRRKIKGETESGEHYNADASSALQSKNDQPVPTVNIISSPDPPAEGRVLPTPPPNDSDAFGSAENGQSISVPDDLQKWPPQTLAAALVLPRPEELILTKLSVVIPTRNGISEGFESTLRAISKQIGIAEIEVVVVDSGSSDGTVQAAKDYGAKVFSIPPEEFNHGATRNYAADQTTGDLLVFTVQDAIPGTKDLYYEMAKALLADSKLAGVSVRQVPKSDADIYACWEMWNHYRSLFEGPPPILGDTDEIDKLPSQQLRRLAGLDNVCSMVRRHLWEKNHFKSTPFAEDLEFGLSCVRQGYSIGLLRHRAVIHSHTRSPFYTMSRHYVDMLVLLKLFEGDSKASWVETVNHNQLFSSVKNVYMAINEFADRLDDSFGCNPLVALRELLSFVAARQGTVERSHDHGGEPTLDRFFSRLVTVFEDDYPMVNPCKPRFEGTINSILEFLADRYPTLAAAELMAIIHKAFASAAGSVLGEYCFWQSEGGAERTGLQILDNLLRGGMQA
jgi:glycosyltransferase involved in cell wall biosynthesis